jgi:circadian clock protein KaiC
MAEIRKPCHSIGAGGGGVKMGRGRPAEQRSNGLGVERMPTGITGFDGLLGGGLPRDRTTLITGGPGCGKTIFALQALVNGARQLSEPGIFVAFEESAQHIIANSASFGWDLAGLARKNLFFLDARLPHTVVHGGEFDLLGLLASVDAKRKEIGAKRIVLDGIDILLSFLNDPIAERREMYRLSAWLSDHKLTGLITCKSDESGELLAKNGYMQFLADCVVVLQHELVGSMPMRLLRVTKCRGFAHATGEVPFALTSGGVKVVSYGPAEGQHVSSQRVSTGIERLDRMLSGGYFRGTSVLISGSSGTAKSTLAGEFIEAAAKRGEQSLYVTFDESAGQVVRNMASVGIRLAPHVKSGVLQILSQRKIERSPVEHVARIVEVIEERRVRCLVVDPVSALAASGAVPIAEELVVRLLDLARSRGVTVLYTTLLGGGDGLLEETATGVPTVADTWIHLSYVVRGGERNRALTIVKSRGVGHSNQVRELVLADRGVTLADVYSAGGEVLMGTMRWQKESEDRQLRALKKRDAGRKQREAKLAVAETNAQIATLTHELAGREAAVREFSSDASAAATQVQDRGADERRLRRADAVSVPLPRTRTQ